MRWSQYDRNRVRAWLLGSFLLELFDLKYCQIESESCAGLHNQRDREIIDRTKRLWPQACYETNFLKGLPRIRGGRPWGQTSGSSGFTSPRQSCLRLSRSESQDARGSRLVRNVFLTSLSRCKAGCFVLAQLLRLVVD